jgi:hypothetical protein
MSADDKSEVFKRISLVVDKIEAVSSEFHKAPVLSPFSNNKSISDAGRFGGRFASNILIYFKQRKFVPSLVVVLLLTVTGGISAFAEDSLPGDYLYLLKVNVNEQVKGVVAVTPEAKARLAVETTERRLQEAVILSSQGKLTDEKKQIIQGQLSKNATDVKNSVADLVASNNISAAQEVSTNFEASLKTHELILATLTKNAEDADVSTTTLAVASSTLDTASSTEASVVAVASSTKSTSTPQIGVNQTAVTAVAQPINTLMQDIRQEINSNTKVREELSLREISTATNPAKIEDKIKSVKTKYADLSYQRKTLTDLSPASIKLFDSYLLTASSTIAEAEASLRANDLVKSMTALQQAVKSMSDSDSLLSIELNSKPEVRKALELIDINKLLNSIHSDDSNSESNSTSTVSTVTGGVSNGAALGTTTISSVL